MTWREAWRKRIDEHNCRHLPVMRGRVMNFELARKTEEIHHMRAYIHGAS